MSQEINQPRLNAAIIGCGRVSIKHIRAIAKLGDRIRLCALVDNNPDAPSHLLSSCKAGGKYFKADKATLKTYIDYKEMLSAEKPDIVAIALPSGLHYQIAKDCLMAGANILLEKPMTMSNKTSRELYELAQEQGKKIAMGHIYRYFPIVSLLAEDMGNGVFGKVGHGSVVVRWGHGDDYYSQAAWRGTWKSDGGALMNQTVHALDLMCYLMQSEAVSANGTIARRFRNMEAEDTAMGVFHFANGALCQVEGTTATLPNDHEASFFINAEKANIRIGLHKGKPSYSITNTKGKNLAFRYLRRYIKQYGFSHLISVAKNPHFGIYKDLYQAITTNSNPIADGRSGYLAVDMVLGFYRSALKKNEVELPLPNEFKVEEMAKLELR
ncbi:MAG: Gfo/Idh/MocA family oxidoreductase [Clostridiales bacterium]|nr:Gfo/Idh/MocA family oxidoreductase [Clostridiales bacterium]